MKRPNKVKPPFAGGSKSFLLIFVLLFGGLLVLYHLSDLSRGIKDINYSTFVGMVEKGEVAKVEVNNQEVQGTLKDKSRFETVVPDTDKNWELLKAHNVDVTIAPPAGQMSLLWYLLPLLGMGLMLFMLWQMIRQSKNAGGGGGSGNIFTMGKSRAKLFMPSMIKETFDSVAGATEAKEELQDVIDFLRNPEKYRRLGAKITRGVLLIGEPGNGKTLLAKAVAGEANCPFFSISGSDFIEVFVGVGAARVRDLFAEARKKSPSIIFIDEIDAVGRHRGSGMGGGNDEREQTLNQLLTEMDGFQTMGTSVIVIAATNRPDVLDKALLRPGRFDRQVEVPYPDLVSREQILRLHAKEVQIDPSVDMAKIARGTPGFTGADLANLINEAAILASKVNAPLVTTPFFEEARDKVMLGKERKTLILTEDERKLTAYHEAGHALVQLMLPKNSDPLHKVTIVPRGQALGVTHSLPERDKYTQTKEEMLAKITMALGGRAAEEIVFNEVTTGAQSDFKMATGIARSMICDYGMSEAMGPMVYRHQQDGSADYSEATAQKIDQEILGVLSRSYDQAKQILVGQRDKLDLLAHELLAKETLFAADIYTLLGIEPRQDLRFTE